ncbi:MAG: PE domain-containing protein [Mycobacterium sp.]|uniref:PPE family protein, SVP subgroup n=1 Tax=Mycobacterium sp. TaxID=1785 RepID=UPI002601AB8D|nr:PE domain-containing protein [Mycobacterium sp.]MDI3314992.1 PE domain-containing protein [Mycobacterium sp.]
MSFVTTVPEALAAAASQLEAIGTSMATENAAIAVPTTGVVPAAADEVSALQAGIFSAYGQLYQTFSAQAQAIHQQFVSTLSTSANSYGATEAANQAGAASTPLSGLGSLLGGSSAATPAAAAASSDPPGNIFDFLNNILGGSGILGTGGLNSNFTNLMNVQVGNWASAASDLIGMGGGGLLTALPLESAAGDIGGLAAGLDGAVTPAAMPAAVGGLGEAPVLASMGQASSLGALSVPPSWAGEGVPVSSAAPATLTGAGWTAAPHTGSVATLPAGMPAGSGGRAGYGYGVPRYGVKPKVMPKPTTV